MAYKFLEAIEEIKTNLSYQTDKAKQELKEINTRQTKLESDLAALEPRQLRAHSLMSRNDLICAHCFIYNNVESPLKPIASDSEVDLFRCKICGREFESGA
ncbi:MAG: hypothetical protein IIA70_03065 [Proteobacteria bacterium]|nr:hypothetical protein [Pseudomonadota bacterium]